MLRVRLATRSSPLALAQAQTVAQAIRALDAGGSARHLPGSASPGGSSLAALGAGPGDDAGAGPGGTSCGTKGGTSGGILVEIVEVETAADRRLDVPVVEIAGEGVFVTEVEQAVIDGRADVAVHSAKDLPSSSPPPGLVLAAVPMRGDPRDALVGRALDDLAPGGTVATGSVRRRAQLAWLRPDLGFVELRGNIATRLDRLPSGGSVVVAKAALDRLGLTARAAHVLPTMLMLPQVGQGALALRCREDDEAILGVLHAIDDGASHVALRAERAFLARVGGGCDAPVGAFAHFEPDEAREPKGPIPSSSGPPWHQIVLEGLIARADGHVLLRHQAVGDDPEMLGTEVAEALLERHGGAGLDLP